MLAETLWPTRCAICEVYGSLLCDSCRRELPYIDQWLACPRCGAPYGFRQCTDCNSFALGLSGIGELPYDACISAVAFAEESSRIVRYHKDAGERGLARHMAYLMACALPPEWLGPNAVVSFIPATEKARRQRGFDHGLALGCELASLLGLRCLPLLQAGRSKDQRRLGRTGRFENAADRFQVTAPCAGLSIILADDVCTTGATLLSASSVLKQAGASLVRCITFARVY